MDISYYYAVYRNGTRSFLSEKYGDIAHFVGAILLIGLGFYIVYSTILQNEETRTALLELVYSYLHLASV